ncbi:hypothetical protein [Cupriavidus sp. USMAA2-4]|uniref:hypothetical protein n=1 Tax=Cupriavidus sp. USMAA2-4 TaxID=876364 RepID=UPI0012F4AC6A|nr:hypothetical protein [Cupriavidus sp. USMAA2-4]
MNANTYMWLIWRSPNDWPDLKDFLPKAAAAGISVWVYLVPPSETGLQDKRFPFPEPFRVDYIRWAQEIAQLSLAHGNLVGYVIDDFWGNVQTGKLTKDYVSRFVAAGKLINPRLKFYPLFYFNEIDEASSKYLSTIADGVVAAYPRNDGGVRKAVGYLRDDFKEPAQFKISFPSKIPSVAGDAALSSQYVRITDQRHARLHFSYKDNFDANTAGFREFQVRVDGTVVWREDVAGIDDGQATVDISDAIGGKTRVTIEIGLVDVNAVGNFPIEASVWGVSGEGVNIADFNRGNVWQTILRGQYKAQIEGSYSGRQRFKLPMILMPSANSAAFEDRYGVAGSSENMVQKIDESAKLVRDGLVEGVVTYSLDKSKRSEEFDLVREIYRGGEK